MVLQGWAGKARLHRSRNFKNPKVGMALTALAGPVANLLLAYLAMVGWKLMYYWAPANQGTMLVAMFLKYMVSMNVGLAVFTCCRCRRWTAAASCWWHCRSGSILA